jgi:S-adenosylmethionine/arginine decarboxylase-like enzyme
MHEVCIHAYRESILGKRACYFCKDGVLSKNARNYSTHTLKGVRCTPDVLL